MPIKLMHKSNNIELVMSLDDMSLYVSGLENGFKLSGCQNKMYDDKEWELFSVVSADGHSHVVGEPLTDGDLELISTFLDGMKAGYKMKADQLNGCGVVPR